MDKKVISWITFNAYLDTDLYVVKELSQFYYIKWYIIKSGNDKIDYINELKEFDSITSCQLEIVECGRRMRHPECIGSYIKLLKRVCGEKSDLLYTSLGGAPFYVPIIAKKAPIDKTILAIHNVHVPKGGTFYSFYKFYNKYGIKRFKHFQTFSISQRDILKEMVGEKDVFYAPFILRDFGAVTRKRVDKKITFLNFGNIRQYKRIDVLIQAAQIAYERTKIPFKVIIAGKCDDWEQYQKLIKYDFLFDLRLSRIENEEIPNLFNESDFFVAPYQDIAQSASAIIALNYEKPIVASKLPAFEEYIIHQKNGYLIKPADIDELADVIENVLKNHDEIYPKLREYQMKIKREDFVTANMKN